MPSSKSVSFSTILHDCSHKERLIQKGWIFRAFPKQMYLCFWLFLWQTVHFSLLTSPIFFRTLSVDSPLCKNWKLKPISFVLFVHWKDNWFAVFQLIVMLISSSQFSWLGMGSSNFFFDTSFLSTGLLGFEFSKKFDKKPSYFSGGLAFWGICLFKSLIADISPWKAKGRTFRLYLF